MVMAGLLSRCFHRLWCWQMASAVQLKIVE
jgi:hypothetical protein